MNKQGKEIIINPQKLPYREGVGMMIINKQKKIFVGKRIDTKIEAWQMPQGGIDIGETPSKAALREMHEEIGSDKGEILAESKKWYSYDLPPFLIPRLWNGRYRGQKQKWFLIIFKGLDEEINIKTAHPEFNAWRWVSLEKLPKIIVPFKRRLYQAVIEEFKDLII